MGFITTRVRDDGQFFLASIDRGLDGKDFRDAHPPLEAQKFYWGHLLQGSEVHQSPWVEYIASVSSVLKGDQLEELPGEFRLVKIGQVE